MKEDFQQGRVSEVAWPWMAAARPAEAAPAALRLRRVIIQVSVMLGVAAVLALWFRARLMAGVVLVLAVFAGATGLWAPRVFDAIHSGLAVFGRWVGVALTWGLLVPFFYIVFVPARIALALRGKDPMKRAFPGPEPTYWISRKGTRSPESYRRQF